MSTKQSVPNVQDVTKRPSAEKSAMTPPPLMIVGMHRSGTSFVASLLQSAGLDIGTRLMPAAAGNELGHFENMDFVDFHMRWLHLTGHHDAGWATASPMKLPTEAFEEAREIVVRNSRSSSWAWKDPRTTLFLDFWSEVIPNASYVFVYREPSEVIDSLYRRGDESISITPELAALAYINHNEIILAHARTRRERCIIVNVSAVAADPQRFLTLITQKFAMTLDFQAPSTFERTHMRIEPAHSPRITLLRHFAPEVERVYSELEAAADIAPETEGSQPSNSLRTRTAFFGLWQALSKVESVLDETIAESNHKESIVQERGMALAAETAHLQRRAIELETLATELQRRNADYDQRNSELHQRSLDLQLQHAEFEREQRHVALEIDNLRELVQGHEAERNELRNAIDEAATLRTAAENWEAAAAMNAASLERAVARGNELERQVERAKAELAAQTEALIIATRAESDRVAQLISAVQTSFFWRLKRAINRMLRILTLRA